MMHAQDPISKIDQPGMTALGQAMPDFLKIPVLTHVDTSANESLGPDKYHTSSLANKAGKLSMIEEGITFTGHVSLQDTCTIAGQIYGNLKEQAGATSQVVITETGFVKGDIFSHKVSVMGTYSGTIDASGGSVDLHAKSIVNGHIRYGQLQVNGADLNATLERVAQKLQTQT